MIINKPEDTEQSLAGDAKRRAKKLVAKLQGWLRPPFCAPEAGRSPRTQTAASRRTTRLHQTAQKAARR